MSGSTVFPEGEEILVGGERTDTGGIGIRSLRGFRVQGRHDCVARYRHDLLCLAEQTAQQHRK